MCYNFKLWHIKRVLGQRIEKCKNWFRSNGVAGKSSSIRKQETAGEYTFSDCLRIFHWLGSVASNHFAQNIHLTFWIVRSMTFLCAQIGGISILQSFCTQLLCIRKFFAFCTLNEVYQWLFTSMIQVCRALLLFDNWLSIESMKNLYLPTLQISQTWLYCQIAEAFYAEVLRLNSTQFCVPFLGGGVR